MLITIYAVDMSGNRRKLDDCLTDSPNRACQMYEDDCELDEHIEWEEKAGYKDEQKSH